MYFIIHIINLKIKDFLWEVKLSYGPVWQLIGRLGCHYFLIGRKVSLPCSYWGACFVPGNFRVKSIEGYLLHPKFSKYPKHVNCSASDTQCCRLSRQTGGSHRTSRLWPPTVQFRGRWQTDWTGQKSDWPGMWMSDWPT